MEADRIAVGAHTGTLTGPAIIEVIALAGFDAAFIDLEHAALDLRDLQVMVVAANAAGISSVVRVPLIEQALLLRVLDMGAEAIYVPHVGTAQEAQIAVRAVRYAPLGNRGMAAASRAARYGTVEVSEHVRRGNDDVVLAVMIEDAEALDHVDEIAAVPGIDLLAIGPSDLAHSLALPPELNHPVLLETIERIARAAATGGVQLAVPLKHRLLDLPATNLHELGVRYGNVGGLPETRLLSSLKADVSAWQGQRPS